MATLAMSGVVGTLLTGVLSQHLFSKPTTHQQGPQLTDLSIQSSAYGHMIPIIYGTVRLAGNIIWATEVRETAHNHNINYGGKGGGRQNYTQYTYSVSLAIAICEGEISDIKRLWADDEMLHQHDYRIRIYNGSAQQEPDPLIESIQGVDKTPAYRGIAYVVLEDFPLTAFGNRLPHFFFEVTRELKHLALDMERPEQLVKSITIIPGAGEFVYDTLFQYKQTVDYHGDIAVPRGNKICLNQHAGSDKANALLALYDLKRTLPNVEWVAPVVSWFASDLDIANCQIAPGVEFQHGATTTPDVWQVAGRKRHNATPILCLKDSPIYGGTPSDASVIRFLQNLKERGYKIMFYPMLFLNDYGKPWRGKITGKPEYIRKFFAQENGYDNFILHYAKLTANYIDAFIIGSELIGLTSINDNDKFPAVEALCQLAKRVRQVLPKNVSITYAADWSEYHHTNGGWYNLDQLWACPDIDVVGIDAYFPLTEGIEERYDVDAIKQGWQSGQGYDYYYNDARQQEKMALSPPYAWKNIRWWWENQHYNPDGQSTSWRPRMKKIWFTEYGFPSVDLGSNQPNVFYGEDSIEGGLPYNSQGYADLQAQRTAILATEQYWQQHQDMVEHLFLWTWDARPYPAWPALPQIWADAYAWEKGHWVQGKMGGVFLAEICADLCQRSGLQPWQFNVLPLLNQPVQGFFINHPTVLSQIYDYLRQAFFFNISENAGQLRFIDLREDRLVTTIATDDLIPMHSVQGNSWDLMQIKQQSCQELPQEVEINYIDTISNYEVNNARARREDLPYNRKLNLTLPLVSNQHHIRQVAHTMLYAKWLSRTTFTFMLPLQYLHLRPLDLVQIEAYPQKIRLSKVLLGQNNAVQVTGYIDEPNIYRHANMIASNVPVINDVAATRLEVLDLPALPFEKYNPYGGRILLAACGEGENWRGCTVNIAYAENTLPAQVLQVRRAAIIGASLTVPVLSSTHLIDQKSRIIINILHGKLHSASQQAWWQGGNLALLGDEIIQFKQARLLAENQYEISYLLRGRYGTEAYIATHQVGERFVLLDGALNSVELPQTHLQRPYYLRFASLKAHDAEEALTNGEALANIYRGNYLKPYSPVHAEYIKQENGDLLLTWQRRAKAYGGWQDFIDVPLLEEKELYQLRLYLKDNTTLLFDATMPQFTIAAVVADALVKVEIAQISGVFGVGDICVLFIKG